MSLIPGDSGCLARRPLVGQIDYFRFRQSAKQKKKKRCGIKIVEDNECTYIDDIRLSFAVYTEKGVLMSEVVPGNIAVV